MDKNDRAEQALNNFWKEMEHWLETLKTYFVLSVADGALVAAYDAWIDASAPPGDPHKEWVDAEKMQPQTGNQLVLVQITDYASPALGFWFSSTNSWRIQQYREAYFDTQTGVTHWRYIPKDDDDG